MNIKKIATSIFLILLTTLSHSQENKKKKLISKTKQLSTNDELKNWHHKDYEKDTIPGISLDKLYASGLLDKYPQSEVIVAVLDTKLNINHPDLKEQIWINSGEIGNNGIDDDKNGYTDDKNGWDFLGGSDGKYIKYQSSEAVRIIKKFQAIFEKRDSTTINKNELVNYQLYLRAKKDHESSVDEMKTSIKNIKVWSNKITSAVDTIKKVINKEKISIQDLDKLINSSKDSILIKKATFLKSAKEDSITEDTLKHYITWFEDMLNKTHNLNHDERGIIGDDPNNINNSTYGNNIVYGEVPFKHSIVVSGVIGANRNNNFGAMGFSNKIKIMPVVMVASGDEYDKDIALAIRYAVNNGAKVINMSWGKKFSLHQDWVLEAIKYAESKNVLIVHGAGNDATNTDLVKYYPNDYSGDTELVDNFIAVGASTYKLNKKLIASFSNYGKNTVDVFAPGVKIYTTGEKNGYEFSRGTSLAAPSVSGLAGLLLSYFPNLTAKELKKIIMDSGSDFEIPVTIKDENNTKKEALFTELSKSGKIINAYNAFLMAAKLSKNKH